MDIYHIMYILDNSLRTSLAPSRKSRPPSPPAPDVSLCLVTYSPDHLYYKGRREIVDLCIRSMLAGAHASRELIIWDNGSTPEYKEFLKSFHPAVFVESENVGGYNARRAMLGIARGRYACITDDDVLFSREWFKEQMEILHNFPGHVATGIPRNCRAEVEPIVRGMENVKLYRGMILPPRWYTELIQAGFIHSPNQSRFKDYIIERGNIRGWLVKMDTQILGRRDFLSVFHDHYEEKTIANSGGICERMSEAGVLQIATLQRTAWHIGNVIDQSVLDIQQEMVKPRFKPDLEGKLIYDSIQ